MDWTFTLGTLTFGVLDIATLVIILIGAVSGCITGFSVSATRLVGIILAIPVSLLFTRDLAAVISERLDIELFWAVFAVFVILSLVVYIVICLLGSQLKNILSISSHLRALDSILGFAWGLAASSITLSLILAILNNQTFLDLSSLLGNSVIIKEVISPIFPTIAESFLGAVNGL